MTGRLTDAFTVGQLVLHDRGWASVVSVGKKNVRVRFGWDGRERSVRPRDLAILPGVMAGHLEPREHPDR